MNLTLPTLRDYQKEAVDFALNHNPSMIVIPTGEGKTIIGLSIISELDILPTKSLVVAPTIEIVKQWGRMIRQFGGECTEVSSETGKQFSDLTIITYASMLLNLDRIKDYSVIIFDEVHHLFAYEYHKILTESLNNKVRIVGLTASPRTQGPEAELQDRKFPYSNRYVRTLAQRQHSDQAVSLVFREEKIILSNEEKETYGQLWDKYVKSIQRYGGFREMMDASQWHGPSTDNEGMISYQKIKKMLSEHPGKMKKTIDIVRSSDGNFIIFTDTIRMVEIIHKILTKEGIPSVKIHSKSRGKKQTRNERDRIISDLKEGKARVLIGCTAIEEGLDLPDMDNAIFLSNISSSTRKVIQRAGRTMRAKPGKFVTIHVIYAEGTKEQDNLASIKRILGVD